MYTFADRFLDGLDDLWRGVRGWNKSDHTTYFPMACAQNKHSFALLDGSLMSVIRINGYFGQYFRSQHHDLVDNWTDFLRRLAKDSSSQGLQMYWSYEYDPDGMKRTAASLRAPLIEASKRRGIDISDVLDEEAKLYGDICATETQVLVIITNINALNVSSRKEAQMEAREARRTSRGGDDAILFNMGIPALEALHEQHISKIQHQLDNAMRGYSYDLLDVYEAAHLLRRIYDPSTTGPGWKARLTTADAGFRAVDGVTVSRQMAQENSDKPLDYSIIMPPSLATQMMSDNVTDLSKYTVVGDRIYAPLFVRELASQPEPLENLVYHCYQAKLPIRLVYYLSADGAQANYANRLLASIFTTFSQSNRQINRADKAMKAYADNDGAPYAFGLSVCTWADLEVSYDSKGEALYSTKKIQQRARDMETYMQSWGGQQLESFFGCAVEATLCATPGYMHPTAAPVAPQIEHDIAMQLPLTRPASIWEPGTAIWLRTSDGVLAPYRPFSSKQSAMITLVMGGMGYGKSNMISEHIMFFASHPEAKETPYIRGIDFGASSSGVMDMLQSQLPPNRRHEVDFRIFVNNGTMCKNLLDTRLGCRYPLEDHFQFLVNWLTVVCNQLTESAGAENLGNIFRQVIRRAYETCDPESNFYSEPPFSMEDAPAVVREAIESCEMETDEHTSAWEIVDFLSAKAIERGNDPELIFAARVAQRYAVPEFAKLIHVSSQMEDQFADMPEISGQPLIRAVTRQLLNANEAFPCFRGRTNIDISESRATVFDVSEAFGRSPSEYSQWLRSVYFTVVMRLLTEDLFVNQQLSGEELKSRQHELGISDQVLQYHLDYLELQDQSIKVFWADELHRISGIAGADEVLTSMCLEGRKYAVGLMLGTQRANAFPPVVLREATSYFIFGASQDDDTANQLQEIFGLEDDERDALRAITPPTSSKGAQCMCVYKTRSGTQRQILHFQMGGLKRWAYATESYERALRARLYSEAPTTHKARQILAKYVPDLKRTMEEWSMRHKGASSDDILEMIAQDMIELSRK